MPSSYPPCPLCGGEPTRTSNISTGEGFYRQLVCQDCGASGQRGKSPEDAEAGWERLTSMVRLPPGVYSVLGQERGNGVVVDWLLHVDDDGRDWEWEVFDEDSLFVHSGARFLWEACDQVHAELEKIENTGGGDGK